MVVFSVLSLDGGIFSGSPAEEMISFVVILPLASRLISPPAPRRENDSIIPVVVFISPSAIRVILPPAPSVFSPELELSVCCGFISETDASSGKLSSLFESRGLPLEENISPVVKLPLLVIVTSPAFPEREKEDNSPSVVSTFPLVLSKVILPP